MCDRTAETVRSDKPVETESDLFSELSRHSYVKTRAHTHTHTHTHTGIHRHTQAYTDTHTHSLWLHVEISFLGFLMNRLDDWTTT